MSAGQEQVVEVLADAIAQCEEFAPLRESFMGADKPQRYRIIASMLTRLADDRDKGRKGRSSRSSAAASVGAGDHELQQLRAVNDELREEIGRLEQKLEELRRDPAAPSGGATADPGKKAPTVPGSAQALLDNLWSRLAATDPPLGVAAENPDIRAVERLVDAFIEWVRFGNDFDQSVRVFLDRYTKQVPTLKRPWEAYVRGPTLWDVAAETVSAETARPVSFLKTRLRMLLMWTVAAMAAADSTLHSIEPELRAHLLGPVGLGGDPKCTIKNYIEENDGPDRFVEHMLALLSQKLLETFGKV
jgi:hypothetical protein